MKTRHVVVVLMAAILVAGLSAAATAGTLADIVKRGELRVAVQSGAAPMAFVDKNGEHTGAKPGRESADERAYFNAVGLSFVDVAIAHAMYQRALERGAGQTLAMQETMIFEHDRIAEWARL